jgi:hypothetical protein
LPEEYWVAADGADTLTRWQLYRGVQSLLGLKSEIRMGQMNVVDISGPDATHNVIRNYAAFGGIFGLIRAHLDELVEATREGKEMRIKKALQETDKLSKQVPLKAWHSLLGHTGSMSSVRRKA